MNTHLILIPHIMTLPIKTKPQYSKKFRIQPSRFFSKVVFTLPKEKQILINLQFSNSSNIPRFDKLNEMTENKLRFAEWNCGPQKRLLISPQLKIFLKISL